MPSPSQLAFELMKQLRFLLLRWETSLLPVFPWFFPFSQQTLTFCGICQTDAFLSLVSCYDPASRHLTHGL